MSRPAVPSLALLLLIASPAATDAKSTNAVPWEAAPMSGSAKDIAAAAKHVDAPEGVDVVVLYEHGRYVFDERGASTYRYHRVYKVMNLDGASDWGSTGASWAPWYQREPVLRARVITPDGVAHPLDPSTIEAAAAPAGGDHMYSDRRSLRAPLPAMQPGAVVEHVIEYADARAYFDEGDTATWYVQSGVPVRRSRLEIDAPSSTTVRYAVSHKKLVRTRTTKRKGRTIRTFDARNLAASDEPEPMLPSDAHAYPTVRFSTGTSWNRVARRYGRIVEEQIAAGDVSDIELNIAAGADRKAIAEAVLAQVHANVRYTGLELGENAIVPWTPAQTWKRKYGDCKDKATLLVALLRRAGVTAHLALLQTGPGLDVHANLPGLGSFNHAIVVIPGAPDLWIDATAEFARVGELPWSDQNRWALVIDDKTRKLTRTPGPVPGDNVTIETRRVTLPEYGKARVVETTELRGAWERSYRGTYRGDDPVQTRKSLTSYADREYLSKKLVKFEHSVVEDLAKPFELRIEVEDTGRAEATYEDAWAFVYPSDTLRALPALVKDEKDPIKPRVADFEMVPFKHEQRYEIAIPAGFRVKQLPENRTVPVGPAVLTTSYREEKDTVYAVIAFDSKKARFSPEELVEMRRTYAELSSQDAVKISFEQLGMAHIAAGRIAEGLKELRALAKEHPTHGLHQAQIARALIEAGLGREARVAARRAVKLEKTFETYFTLAWVLQHDEFGRYMHPGFDLAGTVSALREAKKLWPEGYGIRRNLAVVLEYDERGVRYAGDLDAAIAEYRALRKDLNETDLDANLLQCLLYAGKWNELATFARSAKVDDASGYRIAAAMGADGIAGARKVVQRLGGNRETRAAALQRAAELMSISRHYEQALALYDDALPGSSDAAELRRRVGYLKHMRRHETVEHDGPQGVVVAWMRQLTAHPNANMSEARHLFAPSTTHIDGWSSRVGDGGVPKVTRTLSEADLSPDFILDSIVSTTVLTTKQAGRNAWVVTVDVRPGIGMTAPSTLVFVTQHRGKFRIVSIGAASNLLGAQALQLARRGDTASAHTWLDLAARHSALPESGDTPFQILWSGTTPKDRKAVTLAAAALAVTVRPKAALPVLEDCPRADPKRADACDQLLTHAYQQAGQYARALATVERLMSRPDAKPNEFEFSRHLSLLLSMRRWKDATRLATSKRAAEFGPSTRWLAKVAAARGDLRMARTLYGTDADTADEAGWSANQSAWASLFVGIPDDNDLRRANTAVSRSGRRASTLNTLAAVHAHRGELAAAYPLMLEAMRARNATEFGPQDWLVYGRILQGYGFNVAAKAAYARVEKPKTPVIDPLSSWSLAQKWKADLR